MPIELIILITYIIIAIIAAAIANVYFPFNQGDNPPEFIFGMLWPLVIVIFTVHLPYKYLVILIQNLKNHVNTKE